MASASEYAAWIVANKSKRGTPEFETVVKAYEIAKQSENAAEAPPVPTVEGGGVGEALAGAGEAALTLGTGAIAGMVGAPAGFLKGIGAQIAEGSIGTPEGMQRTLKTAQDAMQAMTYQPRSQTGQNIIQSVGGALEGLPAVMPMIGQAGQITQSLKAAAPMAVASGQRVAAPVAQAVSRVRQSAPEPASIVAAEAGQATTRQAMARNLPVPMEGEAGLTMGQATRNQDVLQFEKETAKQPIGAPLRERVGNQSAVLSKNFEVLIDRIDPATTELRQIGKNVDQALKNRMGVANRKISDAYTAAREAGEMQQPVEMVQLAPVLSELDRFSGVAPNVRAIQNEAVRLGALVPDADGVLSPGRVTLADSELMRQFVNQATDWTDKRQAMVAKRTNEAIDMATDGQGGELYKKARALHRDYVKEFENVGLTKKLTTTKRGTDERQVAYEDVFQKIVVDSPIEEMNKLRGTLLKAGPDGKQSWLDLKAQGIEYIKKRAYSASATDERGNPVLSPDALVKTVRQLDTEGKLDALYGKKQAQVLRDLAELSQVIYTAPPGAINTSGTASALLTAMDTVGTFGTTGLPVPALTVLREASKYVRDRKLKARINQSLNFGKEPTNGL